MSFDGAFAEDELLGNRPIGFSLCNQSCHLALPCGQPSKGLFGGTSWCQRTLLRKHSHCLGEELLPYVLVWYVGSKLLNERSGSRERLLGFFLTPLAVIELAQGKTNTPHQW